MFKCPNKNCLGDKKRQAIISEIKMNKTTRAKICQQTMGSNNPVSVIPDSDCMLTGWGNDFAYKFIFSELERIPSGRV